MYRQKNTRRLVSVILTLGAGLVGGCGETTTAGDCEESTTRSCSCDDGTTGTQLCTEGSWGACGCGDCQPKAEICDGIDNDCDGLVDNGIPGTGATCSVTGVQGVCAASETRCDGVAVVCEQVIFPSDEVCNGLDDDCDGLIDEDLEGTACPVNGQLGPCGVGEEQCVDGALVCTQVVYPQTEICDDVDNDCNGVIDDGDPGGGQACTVTGLEGACAVGTTECQSGSLVCTQVVFPEAEICDDVDNDCDGIVDNGNPGGGGSCLLSGLFGVCAFGVEECQVGDLACVQTVFPTTEICGDGLDNDCDGTTDEASAGCQCTPPATRSCGSDVGYCIAGTQTCLANGTWDPTCVGERLPRPETCNNIDDDCDGSVDENVYRTCYTGPAATQNVGICHNGSQLCTAGSWATTCVGEVTPSTEVCNTADDDCDGQIDETGVWPYDSNREPNDIYNGNPAFIGVYSIWNETKSVSSVFGWPGDVDNFYWHLTNYNQTNTFTFWRCEVSGLWSSQTVRIRVGVHTGGYPGSGPWQFSAYSIGAAGNGSFIEVGFPSPQGPYGLLVGIDYVYGFSPCKNHGYTLTCVLHH